MTPQIGRSASAMPAWRTVGSPCSAWSSCAPSWRLRSSGTPSSSRRRRPTAHGRPATRRRPISGTYSETPRSGAAARWSSSIASGKTIATGGVADASQPTKEMSIDDRARPRARRVHGEVDDEVRRGRRPRPQDLVVHGRSCRVQPEHRRRRPSTAPTPSAEPSASASATASPSASPLGDAESRRRARPATPAPPASSSRRRDPADHRRRSRIVLGCRRLPRVPPRPAPPTTP